MTDPRTAAVRTVEATATKDGRWWRITIPELDQATATKRRSEVQDYAENLAAAALEGDAAAIRVVVSYPLPAGVREDWAQARQDQARARELTVSAAAATKAVVRTLHGSGYSGSDIAAMLGLSVQRISQLLKTKPE